MSTLTHFDKEGKAIMVDVSDKYETKRVAVAKGRIKVSKETFDKIKNMEIGKGDVLGVARVAAIMGAKKTHELIPMCHPLMLTGSNIDFYMDEENLTINIEATVKTTGKTGVEMEALTMITTAALTIYDMCKAIDKKMIIEDIHLYSKSGGKSGKFINEK